MKNNKRIVSIMLIFSMLSAIFPSYVFASERNIVYLEGRVIDESVLIDDVFYIGTEVAYIGEETNSNYLFKVARGGEAKEAATVQLKMIDVTAKYGKDYKIRIHNEKLFGTKVINPKDNESVLETLLNNEDDIEEYNSVEMTTMPAINLEDIEDTENIEGPESIEDVAEANEPIIFTTMSAISPIQAKAVYTGKSSDRVSMDGSDQLQEQVQMLSADYINSFSGAMLEVAFAEGESFKYIEIEPIDNKIGDGERVFQIVLDTPSQNMVNSIYSSMVVKIEDNEVQEEATVTFSQESYYSEDGFIKIELERSNAINQVVGVTLRTEDISAENGVHYAQTHTTVVFPYGISKRTIHIPVNNQGLEGTGEFKVTIAEPVGCEISQTNVATCYIVGGDVINSAQPREFMRTATEADSNSILLDNKLDLAYHVRRAGVRLSGYSRLEDDKWVMHPAHQQHEDEAFAELSLGRHYDYSGFQIDWKLESKQPAYVETIVKADYDIYRTWIPLYSTKDERWNSKPTQVFLKNDDTSHLYIGIFRRGGFLGKSPTLILNSVQPIKRPFEITLQGAEDLYFLTATGQELKNSQIDSVREANRTSLPGATHDGTGMATRFSGDTVTVTSSSAYSYIKGLRIVNTNTGEFQEILSNQPYGTKSVSFELNNNFIIKNLKYINFLQNGSKGKKGAFKVQAVMGHIDCNVNISPDYRGDIRIVNKDNMVISKEENYTFHLGDVLRIGTNLKDEYKGRYQTSEIRFRTQYTKNDEVEDFKLKYDKGQDYCTRTLNVDTMHAEPSYVKIGNEVVVRIPKDQQELFDLNDGIFKGKTGAIAGDYMEYLVVPSAQLSTGTYYEFKAKTKQSSGRVAQWQQSNNEALYSQETFYYQPGEEAEENVLYLKAAIASPDYFSLTGNASYTDTSIDGKSKASAWLKAEDVTVSVGNYKAITNSDGIISTTPMKAIKDHYVRYKIEASGMEQYRTVLLKDTTKTSRSLDQEQPITVYEKSLGDLEVAAINKQVPHIETVDGIDANGIQNGNQVYLNNRPVTLRATICNEGQKYIDHTGKEVEEKVIAVDFVVYDMHTKEQKKVISGATKTATIGSYSLWELPTSFDPVDTQNYRASDKIYVVVTTDRVVGTGNSVDYYGKLIVDPALQETHYAPIFTGLTFLYENQKEPVTQDIDIPAGLDSLGLDKIPLIGDMVATFNVKQVSLSVTPLPDGGTRLSIGGIPKKMPTQADNGVDYGVGDTKKAFGDIKDIGRDSTNKGALILKTWGLYPIFGIYLDFGRKKITEDHHEEDRYKYLFSGGGLYLGATGKFKLTTYFIISYVPCYFGVNGEISMFVNGIVGLVNEDAMTTETLLEVSNSLKLAPEFALQANTIVQAYVGTGLNGTLGVRGGIQARMNYIYNPTIKRIYPSHPEHGAIVSIDVRVWVDALLFTIPVPVYTIYEQHFGYFNEKETEKAKRMMSEANRSGEGLDNQEDAQIMMKPRDQISSSWLPSANRLASRGLKPDASQVLLDGGYERAEPQLMDLGNNRTLLTFVDDDKSRTDENRTVLKYSIYENGSWSAPTVIQDDGTADFQPNLCDAGDSVMISWISRDPQASGVDPIPYAQSMEVYTVLMKKSSTEIGKIERLTEDSFLDTKPTGLYDTLTGDRMVYYVKSSVIEDDFEKTVSPTNNDSVIVYMLYDHSKGEWVRTYYYENEVEGAAAQEKLVKEWGGQRFLASPIDAFNMVDPVIIDFNAISYNGLGVYSYTVDADNNIETNADRELFVQVYDFETHKTYKPIRVTKDNVADALPQLVRNGEHTYLFWLRNDNEIRYIDVTDLVKNGINDNGTIKEDYDLNAGAVFYSNSTPGQAPTYASYKAYVDKEDNLYIAWLQPVTTEDGKGAQEIFASALIRSDASENVSGISWSEGVQVTKNARFNDEHAFIIKGDGSVLLVSNQYDQDLSREDGITNVQLVATDFVATGSVEATDIQYENAPLASKVTTVNCTVKNTGLKPAKGYTVNVYEVRDGIQGKLIHTVSETEILSPSSAATMEFEWTLPEDYDGIKELSLRCETKENDFQETHILDGQPITIAPVYDISLSEISQKAEGFVISYVTKNIGNQDYVAPDAPQKAHKVLVRYNNLYNTPEKEKIYLDLPMDDLAIGETKAYEAILAIPDGDLIRGGTAAYIEAEDGEQNIISNYETFDITLEYPTAITVNNDPTLSKITLKKGDKLTLTTAYAQKDYLTGGKVAYETDDYTIASVENGVMSANDIGSTNLNVRILPYGAKKTLKVEVIANTRPDESESSPSVKPLVPNKPEPIKPDMTKPTVDLKEEIEKTKENEIITVQVTKENEAATVYLGAKDLVEMSKKNITLSVKSEGVAYNLPTSSIDIDKILKQLGIASADQVVLKITIASPSKDEVSMVEKAAKDGNYELLLPPVDFSITASSADKAVEIVTFKDYVERIIDIPEGIDMSRVITGMKFDKDGSAHHVPTKVFQKDGKWYASISSLTNSIYTLIHKEANFIDTAGKWYENVVNEMAARMIVGGVGDGQFAGERQITRAEFAAMTVKALGLKTDGIHQFSDVSPDAWYSGAIGKAYEYGIVNGIGEGLFAPSEKITRQEAMAMIHNASKIAKIKEDTKPANEKFSDQGLVSDWAQEAVRYNVEKGLIVGNDGKLNPKEYISRAETATVLLRLLQKSDLVDVRMNK